ncbi:UDP-3-O-(3-hydroxymyristoyl)glucosamine N-acyltransferase [Celeribacter litoreus]|uniref:UDP-3-O-(3-hydroxymyristoyl)glucosamine N-acyltransferase n=1 Tax=Celeribacter litoreus TaxID=2876714 RepID=UPI001CCE6513|nr:UDP-3-O-(3-hydroxymyristoyl)glucosamine N-acyltransferase [Celeribacter litoreus]MCA0043868.1 UDP-3-O-(3-hydroxymyristoyl)glucosamine N-acyltransferase [Celeribacter litoreus]
MSITIAELAATLNAPFEGDGTLVVAGAAEPQDAGETDLALAMDPRFAPNIAKGQAKVAVLWDGADWADLGLEAAILVKRGRLAMAGVTAAFAAGLGLEPGIHPAAVVDPSAEIGAGAAIGPFVVIGKDVKIGANAQIAPHVSIGAQAQIGDDALIHAGVKIGARVVIGNRLIAQPGGVVGSDGFSFVTAEKSHVEEARESLGADVAAEGQAWMRIASIGAVVIGDDVELGANVTIDQGTIRPTRIGDGTKLDNQVHIGHNVIVGRHCLLCGQVGVAGSTVIGDYCVMGGQAGAADNLTIGSGAIIGAGTGVLSNVAKGKAMMGYPAVAMQTHVEMYKALRRLPRFMAKLKGDG